MLPRRCHLGPHRPPALPSNHDGVGTPLKRAAEVPSSSLWTQRPEALPESWPSAAVVLNVTFMMEAQVLQSFTESHRYQDRCRGQSGMYTEQRSVPPSPVVVRKLLQRAELPE